ncbi:MAG: DUF6498-containing protein [Henriciella sp.]|nr:DUF6498-containing protein [Henriciella sp.]
MRNFLDPNTLARTYRDPVAWVILAVDLFPIWAVLTMGWGAAPLVFLYWLENLIVGAVALARMIASSMKESPFGLLGMVFLGPFFTVHYGMFCFVHGIFVAAFANMETGGSFGFLSPWGLFENALNSAPNMPTFIGAIIVVQVFLYVRDFIMRGQYKETDVGEEMAAPYGRVVVLHFGIFAGAGGLALLGNPLWGILALIGLRAIWGVFMTVRRRMRLDGDLPKQKVDVPS